MVLPLESRLFLSAAHPADLLPPVTVSGVVYADANNNGKRDPGEKLLQGCVVTFNNNLDHTVMTPVTFADGSYAAQLEPGSYHVSADGPSVTKSYDKSSVFFTSDQTFDIPVSTDKSGSTGGTTSGGKKVDLSVSLDGVPAKLTPTTKPVIVTLNIANKGDAFSGKVTTSVYFSKNRVVHDTDHHLTVTSSAKIGKNSSVKPPIKFNIALIIPFLPAGKYFLIAKISTTGDMNASNNIVVSQAINVAKKK